MVDTLGHPEAATIRISAGTDPTLVDAIRAVVPGWRYTPATADGCKVEQLVSQSIEFN